MNSYKIFLFYTIILCFISPCLCKKYNNYTLYRVVPSHDDHLVFLYNLTNLYDVNFWRGPGVLFKPVEFVISPKDRIKFVWNAAKLNLYLTTLIEDVQAKFDKQIITSYVRRRLATFNWKGYYRLNDIYSWLEDLQKKYPHELTLKQIGTTHEGRKIIVAKIVLIGCKRRSNIIIEGGIHAREWIAPAFATYMLHEILRARKGTNAELLEIALTYEWYFVPVINPDGYEYSHTTDRMWRKNRSYPSGVDLNRNFNFEFATVDNSNDPTSEIYCGANAFSENETLAMASLIRAKGDRLEYYFGFHSYGQDIIIPYSHTDQHVENYDEVFAMAKNATEQIAKKYHTYYTVGTAFEAVGYKASGASGCWTKKNFHVPYVLYFELRDDGTHAFTLPPKEILPTCEETMNGMISLLRPRTDKLRKLGTEYTKHKHNAQNIMAINPVVIFCCIIYFIIEYLK